ncbi:hypothetical protein, partial [Salmonella enterica]|uniref:hypothetical protein n=1 Tax=Salmonella enterica TaxID=28901 RepID=UPI003297C726
MIGPRLKRLKSVKSMAEDGVYFASIETVSVDGSISHDDFCSRPNDGFGLGPDVRAAIDAWISDGNPVLP